MVFPRPAGPCLCGHSSSSRCRPSVAWGFLAGSRLFEGSAAPAFQTSGNANFELHYSSFRAMVFPCPAGPCLCGHSSSSCCCCTCCSSCSTLFAKNWLLLLLLLLFLLQPIFCKKSAAGRTAGAAAAATTTTAAAATNVSRGRNVPSEISYKKLAIRSILYTFLEAGCWLAASCCTAAVALTAAASACVCCCLLLPAAACCCLLLPAAACCLLLLLVAATACGAAVVLLQSNSLQSKKQQLLLLLCPQRHGPAGRGNTMALKDERSPKYAFPEAGTSLLKSPRKSLLYVSRCWLLARC